MATAAITCTPEGVITGNVTGESCLNCLSDKKLDAIMAYLLCKINGGVGANCTANTLSSAAACFDCMSDHQRHVGLVNILLTTAVRLGAVPSESSVISAVVCLDCLPPRMLRSIILKQLCTFWNAEVEIL